MIRLLVQKSIRIFLILVGLFPARKKTIVFESFLGKQFSCNPKAIYDYMLIHHPEYTLYWSVDRNYKQNFDDSELRVIERFTWKWLMVLGTSRYWVTNSRLPSYFKKPRHTTYIQTWHGTPLKKLVFDMEEVHMPGTTKENYFKNFYNESRNWDFLISPNAYSSGIFKRAFKYDKPIPEVGYPRNDVLFNRNTLEDISEIKRNLKLPKDKKIILYAPTWRDNQHAGVGKYTFDLPIDLQKLQNEFGDKYIVILRMHYLVAQNLNLESYKDFAYDFSQSVDINELYLISDVLITDYSSVFFDYGNLKRPIIFYMYDLELYRDTLRGFYFNIEQDAPGPIAKNMEELEIHLHEVLSGGISKEYIEKYDAFYEKYCYLEDGFATKRIVDKIVSKD